MHFKIRIPDYSELVNGTIAPDVVDNLDKFINYMWTNYEKSEQYKKYYTCIRYYENDNEEIEQKRRFIYERMKDSNEICRSESKRLSNKKINHAYYKKLVKQKAGFLLSSLFQLTSKEQDDDRFKAMYKELKYNYLTDKFHRTLKNCATYSCVKGIDWIHAYWSNDELLFERIPAEQVCPIWADAEQTELEALIHCYVIEEFDTNVFGPIKRVHYDYYTNDFVARYIRNQEDADLRPTSDIVKEFLTPYFYFDIDGSDLVSIDSINPLGIPWICFRYEENFSPLLNRVKPLIDEQDFAISEMADQITDIPNSTTMMIRNYTGTNSDEVLHNIKTTGLIFVEGDGDVKAIEVSQDINAVLNYINQLNSAMYEVANGIDSSSKDTRDTSGTALSQLYRELSAEIKEWEIELRTSIRKIISFMIYDIMLKSEDNVDYSDVIYDIDFVYDIIVNETEQIQNALTSKGLVSDKTNLSHHPYVNDVDWEMSQIEKEEIDKMDLQLDYEIKSQNYGSNVTTEVIETEPNLDGVRGAIVDE